MSEHILIPQGRRQTYRDPGPLIGGDTDDLQLLMRRGHGRQMRLSRKMFHVHFCELEDVPRVFCNALHSCADIFGK